MAAAVLRALRGGPFIGPARNVRLGACVALAELMITDNCGRTGVKQSLIDRFACAADSEGRQRRAITRLE